MAANTPHETSLDMNELSSFITAITKRNPGISSCTWGASDCLPIYIKMQRPSSSPVNSPPQLGKIFLSLTFQAILALFFSLSSSSPPFPTVLFGAVMLIGFAVSFAGVLLQNAFPKIALLLEKLGALFAAIGICIIASLLVHPNLAWICWLACGFFLLAFIISFKWIWQNVYPNCPSVQRMHFCRIHAHVFWSLLPSLILDLVWFITKTTSAPIYLKNHVILQLKMTW